MKKNFRNLIFFIFILFIIPHTSFASQSLRINEVMYNPEGSDQGREWIEVYNNGDTPVDISQWYFWEGGTFHGLYPESTTMLSPGNYALIVQNLDSIKSELGSSHFYVKSSFSLKNTGEELRLADAEKNTVSSFSYSENMGANGNGKSLQYLGNSWREANMSPGRENSYDASDGESNTGDNSSDTGNSNNGENEYSREEDESIEQEDGYTYTFLLPQSVMEGEDVPIRVSLSKGKENIYHGVFIINYGDGKIEKNRDFIKNYHHRYIHSGLYPIIFEYYSSSLLYDEGEDPELYIQKNVRVLPSSDISIEKVNPYDGVVLYNNTSRSIPLEGWSIHWNKYKFIFPHATIVLPHNSIRISYKILGFSPKNLEKEKVILKTNTNFSIDYFPKKIFKSYVPKRKSDLKKKKTSHTTHKSKEKVEYLSFEDEKNIQVNTKHEDFDLYAEKHPGKVFINFEDTKGENFSSQGEEKNSETKHIFILTFSFFILILSSLFFLSHRIGGEDEREQEDSETIIEITDE